VKLCIVHSSFCIDTSLLCVVVKILNSLHPHVHHHASVTRVTGTTRAKQERGELLNPRRTPATHTDETQLVQHWVMNGVITPAHPLPLLSSPPLSDKQSIPRCYPLAACSPPPLPSSRIVLMPPPPLFPLSFLMQRLARIPHCHQQLVTLIISNP
jgi:hypothetical protein